MLWKPLLCRHVIQLGPRIEVASKFRRFPDRRSQSTISSATSSIQRYTSFRDQQFIVLRPDIESNVVHSEHRFPVLWLRDNCQCTECFHSHSTSRIHDWTRFDVDVQPKEISVCIRKSVSFPQTCLHNSVFCQSLVQQRHCNAAHRVVGRPSYCSYVELASRASLRNICTTRLHPQRLSSEPKTLDAGYIREHCSR